MGERDGVNRSPMTNVRIRNYGADNTLVDNTYTLVDNTYTLVDNTYTLVDNTYTDQL